MSFSRRISLCALSLLSAFASACGVETVVQDLNEREANLIVETLADSGIEAGKLRVTEGRNFSYSITVPAGSRIEAYKTLNQNELPRRRDKGNLEVFATSGLIPSAAEERAKSMAALEGEIEGQLKLVAGVLDAQVQIVTPEESALHTTQDAPTPTTASVTIKYLPDGQGHAPLKESQIALLVSRGVEKLTPENVFVLLAPATTAMTNQPVAADMNGESRSWLGRLSRRTLNIITIAVLVVITLLCLGLVFSQMRLWSVRGRLLRLQNEIAKARRKPNEGAPSNAA